MNFSRSLFLLCVSAFATGSLGAERSTQLLKLPGNVGELITHHKARSAARRSTLEQAPTWPVLGKPVAQNDNNEGVLPLFGPDMIEYSAEYDATYCQIAAAAEFCENNDPNVYANLFKVLCPISCEQDPVDFCVQDDGMAAYYSGKIALGMLDASGGCATLKSSLGHNPINSIDLKQYTFCDHDAFGIMCPETCNTNCWSWPYPYKTMVYLPDCKEVVTFPAAMHKEMTKNVASPGDLTICPP